MKNTKVKQTRVLCIYHRVDLDGWMSAAIVKRWFEENYKTISASVKSYEDRMNNPSPYLVVNANYLDMYGYNYGDEFLPDITTYDQIILTDISVDDEILAKALSAGKTVTYIDHHAKTIKRILDKFNNMDNFIIHVNAAERPEDKQSACELTYEYFNEDPAPELVEMLGAYDCFRHKSFSKIDEDIVLYCQYGARAAIDNYEKAYSFMYYPVEEFIKNGEAIKKYLDMHAKSMYDSRTEVFLFGNFNPELNYDPQYKFALINSERLNPANFGINYFKDGYDGVMSFWYADGKWQVSLYSENPAVDCAELAAKFGGGGHRGAAGFRLNSIELFIEKYGISKN